jgi:hypothetical protein
MRLILKVKVPILLAFALVALIAAGCGGPDPTGTPNVPAPTPATPATAVPNEAPRNAIAFDMREAYEKGEPVEIAIVNNSTDVYYYQHH